MRTKLNGFFLDKWINALLYTYLPICFTWNSLWSLWRLQTEFATYHVWYGEDWERDMPRSVWVKIGLGVLWEHRHLRLCQEWSSCGIEKCGGPPTVTCSLALKWSVWWNWRNQGTAKHWRHFMGFWWLEIELTISSWVQSLQLSKCLLWRHRQA